MGALKRIAGFSLLLLLESFRPAAAQSACLPPLRLAESAQPAQSIHLYVAALGRADRAHAILANIDTAGDALLALRRAAAEARCAGNLVGMVSPEADSITVGSLGLAGAGFEMVAIGIDGMRESVIRQIDDPAAGRSAREADNTAATVELIDEGWRNLMTVTLGVIGTLKQFDQAGRVLAVTSAEKDMILSEVTRQFGGELTEQNAMTNYARLSAYTIASFLRHPDWKPRP